MILFNNTLKLFPAVFGWHIDVHGIVEQVNYFTEDNNYKKNSPSINFGHTQPIVCFFMLLSRIKYTHIYTVLYTIPTCWPWLFFILSCFNRFKSGQTFFTKRINGLTTKALQGRSSNNSFPNSYALDVYTCAYSVKEISGHWLKTFLCN